MGSRWVVVVVTILVLGGTTAGGIAAGGGGHSRSENAAEAQYTPGSQGEHNGNRTCAQLAAGNRRSEANIRTRHRRLLRRFHGRQRASLAAFFAREERLQHRHNVAIEQQCRSNGGA